MNDIAFQSFQESSAIGAWIAPRHRRTLTQAVFTTRHLSILREVALGKSNKEIAKALSLSPETVKHHLKGIFKKLGVSARSRAVIEARRCRLIL
jgi:DNA-binding NarL/FixJ family response regulator